MSAIHRKKFLAACAAIFIGTLLLTGCSLSAENEAADSLDHSSNTSDLNTGEYFDLNAGELFEVTEKAVSDSIFVFDNPFYTNSQTISVTNNSSFPIEVYLFQKDTPEQAIQQFTLDSNSSQSFTNLTSRLLYQIGISTATDSNIQLTISN